MINPPEHAPCAFNVFILPLSSLTSYKLLYIECSMAKIIGGAHNHSTILSLLSQLPDPYIISPNYQTPFSPPTLINYLLIGPTGIHLIFTQNYDIKYLKQANDDLRKIIHCAIKSQRPSNYPYGRRERISYRILPFFDHYWSPSPIHIGIILCPAEPSSPAHLDTITILSTSKLNHHIQSRPSQLDTTQINALSHFLHSINYRASV